MRDGFWLGAPGMLVPLPDVKDSLSTTPQREMNFRTTMGGRRTATLAPAAPRDWSVSLSGLSPSRAAQVQAVLATLSPPYVWITPWAARVNILSPKQSLLQGISGTPGGLRQIDGGAWVPSLVSPTTLLATGVPVMPGVKVTAAVHARPTTSSVTVSVEWIDSGGASMGPFVGQSASLAAAGPLGRVSVTATPPAGACTLRLRASGASIIAAASVTFTPEPFEWGLGEGCTSVVVSMPQFTPSTISESASGDRYGSISFDVHEVG